MNSKIIITIFGGLFGVALAKDDCWSTNIGIPCCELKTTKIEFTDNTTGEQYGIEDSHICGINDIQLCPNGDNYQCCKSCDVVYTDSTQWGYEDDDWCSIPFKCNFENNNNMISNTFTTKSTSSTIIFTSTNKPEPTQCSKEYEMCGGSLYPDSPDCCEGTFCYKGFSEYHQCIPNKFREELENPSTTTSILEPIETITSTIEPKEETTTTTTTTTSTTTTTTTRTTTTTTTTPKPSCGPSYSMCGGNLYPDAPNCCEDGNFCWKSHPDYYQCIPNYLKEIVDSYTTTQFFTSTKTKTSTATATPTNCSKGYFPCGGTNNPEASSCCEEGFYCHQHDVYYHQCLPYEDDSECASVYDVCGGSLFPDAPGCCEKGAKCVAYDESYSRCLPEDSTYTPPKCAKIGEPCGGTSYPNAPTCCENGGLCIAYNSSYSKCLENPDGFP